MPKKSTLLKLTALALAPVLAVGITVRRDIDRAWEELDVRLDALAHEREARPTLREALYGETVDERAWPHYEEALAGIAAALDKRPRTYNAAEASTPEERAERDALLAELDDAFAALRRGAHARDARTAIEWDIGWQASGPRLSNTRMLAIHAVANAQASVERGKDRAAVETLLDMHQFGRDLACSPCLIEEMIGLSGLAPEHLLQWLATGGAHAMSADQKLRWLAGLDALLGNMPRVSHGIVGDVELTGRALQRTIAPAAPVIPGFRVLWRGPDFEPGWRHRFSWRYAATDFVIRGASLGQRIEAAGALEPVAAHEQLRTIQQEVELDRNPLLHMFAPKALSAWTSRRYCLGKLDFLRHALALHLGQEPELPVDPFGNGVQVEVTEQGVRVFTVTQDTGPLDVRIAR